jgi:signal peptidase I
MRAFLRRTPIVLALAALSGCGSGSATHTSQTAGARVFRVPSGSMEPTLRVGARIVVVPRAPKVGEIVVFHAPADAERQLCGSGPAAHTVRLGGAPCDEAEHGESSVTFVKRIVAGPGDEVSIADGHVVRNGVREPEPYVKACEPGVPQCNFPKAVRVPPGQWFMLGDNRGESDDSRFWGPVPSSWIVGTAIGCVSLKQLVLDKLTREAGGPVSFGAACTE